MSIEFCLLNLVVRFCLALIEAKVLNIYTVANICPQYLLRYSIIYMGVAKR